MANTTTRRKNLVTMFRGEHIPHWVKNKTDLIGFVLQKHRYDKPITNWEFVSDLNCHRFGGVLHNLRQEGWDICSLRGKQGAWHYYLNAHPNDENKQLQMDWSMNNE